MKRYLIGDTVEKSYLPNVIIKRAESFFDKKDYAEAIIDTSIPSIAPCTYFGLLCPI